jgi:predicted transcriptional regulator
MAALKKTAIAVSQENLDILESIAKKEDRSRNWLINQAIALYIENYNNKEKE